MKTRLIDHKVLLPREPKKKFQGVGDVVAAVAKPAAKLIDKAAAAVGVKTDLANCGGCHGPGGRQERLNKKFPFKQ